MREIRTAGRPREFDELETLSKLMNIFWEKGFEGTSLSDMVGVTNLKKGSLYAAFGSKHDMYLKALAHYEALVVDSACTSLTGGDDPMARIDDFLSSPIEAVWNKQDTRGCFLCNASADKAALDSDTHALVRRGYNKLEGALGDALGKVKPKWGDADINAKARLLLAVYSGLRVMARSAVDRETLEEAKRNAMQF